MNSIARLRFLQVKGAQMAWDAGAVLDEFVIFAVTLRASLPETNGQN